MVAVAALKAPTRSRGGKLRCHLERVGGVRSEVRDDEVRRCWLQLGSITVQVLDEPMWPMIRKALSLLERSAHFNWIWLGERETAVRRGGSVPEDPW